MSRSGGIGELFRYRGKQQEKQLKAWCSLPLVFGAACKERHALQSFIIISHLMIYFKIVMLNCFD